LGGAAAEGGPNTIQYCVSQLRKSLGADRIVTRPPGYLIRVKPGELDLERFELLLEQDHAGALREALALWRGPALADLAFEPFALAETARLEELRFAALERRLDLDLEDGRAAELVGELEGVIAEHPLRERLRGQLMVALYRAAGRGGRRPSGGAGDLVRRLGQPGPALRGLEQAILRQEPSLLATRAGEAASPGQRRSVIVAPMGAEALDSLLAIAEPLAGSAPPRELILVRLVHTRELGLASRLLHERSASLSERGVAARSAVFTSHDPGAELTRLASEQHADLVLLDAPTNFLSASVFGGIAGAVLASAACDVGIVVCRDGRALAPGLPILVPFAGAEHDWAAVELAAWIARATGTTLRLLGREADLAAGDRDASRLLAQASLLVQRVVRVPTESILVAAGSAGILRAADRAGLLVFGLSDRWRQDGLGQTRLTIARVAACPTLLVRRGLKPGGIAPNQTLTRFTWSLANARP
jgi:hypothetical protein